MSTLITMEWSSTLFAAGLRGLLLLATAWALILAWPALARFIPAPARRLGNLPGSLQHRLWIGVFLALLLLPVLGGSLSGPLPGWRLPVAATEALPLAPPTAETTALPSPVLPPTAGSLQLERDFSRPVAPPPAPKVPIWLMVWCLGVVAVLGRQFNLWLKMRRIAAQGQNLEIDWGPTFDWALRRSGVHRRVRLVESPEVVTPMTGGFLRPVVLLPETSRAWSTNCRRMVLLHELVHIRRGDWLLHILAQLACALHWWNPLAWAARRRLDRAREAACDEEVIARGARPSDYASHLLQIADELRTRNRPALAALAMASTTDLEGRLMSILSPRSATPRPWQTSFALATLLVLVLAFTTLDLAGAPGADEETAPEVASSEKSSTMHTESSDFDGFHLNSSVRGPMSFTEGEGFELLPGGRIEIHGSKQGSTFRLEIEADEATGEQRETLYMDGEAIPIEGDARELRDLALQVFEEEQRRGALRGQMGALQGEIGAILGEAGALRGQIGALHGQRAAFAGELAARRGETARLRSELAALQAERAAVRAEEMALRKHAEALERELMLQRQRSEVKGEEAETIQERLRVQQEALEAERARVQERLERGLEERHRFMEERQRAIEERMAAAERESERVSAEQEQRLNDAEIERQVAALQAQIEQMGIDKRLAEVKAEIAALRLPEKMEASEARLQEIRQRLVQVFEKLAC